MGEKNLFIIKKKLCLKKKFIMKKNFGARSSPKIFLGQNFFSKGYFPRTNSGGGTLIEWSNFAFQGG